LHLETRERVQEEEEEFFNHYKNDLERHAHTPSGVAGADLKSQSGGSLRTPTLSRFSPPIGLVPDGEHSVLKGTQRTARVRADSCAGRQAPDSVGGSPTVRDARDCRTQSGDGDGGDDGGCSPPGLTPKQRRRRVLCCSRAGTRWHTFRTQSRQPRKPIKPAHNQSQRPPPQRPPHSSSPAAPRHPP